VSGAGVGGTSKRDRVIGTIIGLVAAAAVTGAAFAATLIISSLIFGRGTSTGSSGLYMLIMATIAGGTGGLVPAFVIGLPLHHYFVRRAWNKAPHYAGFGIVTALVTALLILMFFSLWFQGANMFQYSGTYFVLGMVALAGIAGGETFWIIRRPDRDAPPIPDEVFA